MPTAGLKPILTRIQIQSRNWLKGTNIFVRTRPAEIIDGAEVWQATMDMVGFRDEGGSGFSDEILVCDPDILMDLPENAVIHRYRVYYCVTQRGRPHLWRVRLPGDDGRMYGQWEMLHDAAAVAERTWVTLNAESMPIPAPSQDREPEWPDLTWGEVLQKAFRDKIVDALTTPNSNVSGVKSSDVDWLLPPTLTSSPATSSTGRTGRPTRRPLHGRLGSRQRSNLALVARRAGASPPFPTDATSLFVAYYNGAEFNAFRALGWPLPERSVDLCAEFKALTNGLTCPTAGDCWVPCSTSACPTWTPSRRRPCKASP